MSKNYFDILKVGQEATQAEIKDAYKRLAVQYHPDKNPSPDAEQQFKEINEAYEVLGDFYQRLLYEKELNGTVGEAMPEQAPAPEPQKEVEENPEPAVKQDDAPQPKPSNTAWWKKGAFILFAPIAVLGFVGLGKIWFGGQNPSENQPETPKNAFHEPNQNEKIGNPASLWELKRIWATQPATAILRIDQAKQDGQTATYLDSLRQLALGKLLPKSAYYFQTSDCEKGKQAYALAKENGVEMSAHLQKQLDFYAFRCAIEQEDYTTAEQILAEMEERYQHQFSILYAKAHLLHYGLKQPQTALSVYKQARFTYQPQKADAQFVTHWQSAQGNFTLGQLLADYAKACFEAKNTDLGKRIAIESARADSTQTLAFELIAQQLQAENQQWGACKYWKLAAANGSAKATEAVLKGCE